MTRPVTEYDFRQEQFKHPDIKPEQYEFRDDGKLVRKDRWETAIRKIANILDNIDSREFEIDEVIMEVENLQRLRNVQIGRE